MRLHFTRLMGIVLVGLLATVGVSMVPAAAHGSYGGTQAMLAVIGTDGNVSVYDADGRNPIRVTTDAVPDQKVYQWPTWATDGRLAFFGSSSDPADSYLLRMYVIDQVKVNATVQTAFTSNNDIFTYAYWGPGDCAAGNCRDLALLSTPTDQSNSL